MIGYLVPGPRDARQPITHFSGQAALHQPVAVRRQQERGQEDGQLSLQGRGHVRMHVLVPNAFDHPGYMSETSSYPHGQVGPKVNNEDGDGLPPVIDGVDKVQTLLFLSVQHTEHS